MYSFFSYIKFLFSATNQHGVHSPFVYAYVTKCLYSKGKFADKKAINIFLKSISYFNSKTLKIDSKNEVYLNYIKKDFANIKINSLPYDALYIESCKDWDNIILEEEIKNTSWVFINNIHKNKEENSLWEQIKTQKEITVSIDLFYCGLIFFRKEQEKEHFKIRC